MTDPTPTKSALRRIVAALLAPSRLSLLALLVIGGLGGILFWGGFNTALEVTNTLEFCTGCHEMRDTVYVEYQKTIHYSNRSGVRATCPDCHVPKQWVYKVLRKVHATNELFHKLLGTIDTKEKFEKKRYQLAKNEWKHMKETDSRECRNCHHFDGMNPDMQKPVARQTHTKARAQNKTCIDCHKGIAHDLPAEYTGDE
jgi:cytochrome c-type protein NapC